MGKSVRAKRVVFEFSDPKLAKEFIGWFLDGGGEDALCDHPRMDVTAIEYEKREGEFRINVAGVAKLQRSSP